MSDGPGWRAFDALLFVLFLFLVIGAVVLSKFDHQLDTIEGNQADGRERAYIQRAQACVLQPDDLAAMGAPVTAECRDPLVVVWYPREVCEAVPEFGAVPECGRRAP